MTISDLARLVTTPSKPLHVDAEEELRSVERYLDLALPSDYLQLTRRYGTGCFGDATFYFWINNPLRPRARELFEKEILRWREWRRALPEEYEYDLVPVRPGYLPCGADVDGGCIGWIAAGPPDRWPVVAKSRDAKRFEVYRMSLTAFLSKALLHEIRPEVWRPDFPEDVSRVTFVPGEHYHQSVAYRD